LLSMYLMKHAPETKAVQTELSKRAKFDIVGLIILIVAMLSVNLIITQSSNYGFFSPFILMLIVIFIISIIVFILFESKIKGILMYANTYFSSGLLFTSVRSCVMSITYLVAVLVMIRVGETVLQAIGPKKPMLIGAGLNAIGIILISLTFLPTTVYVVSCVLGYLIYGIGLGMYATPSTDTAVTTAPEDKVGVASGVYKMASSLGNSFGVAISGTIFSMMTAKQNIHVGAMYGLWFMV